jgi:serine/threonine protein kinase
VNVEDGRVVGTEAGGAATGGGRLLAGRYLLGARLGRGGMGTVWRARDQMLDRDVAVKELSVGHLSEEDLYIVQSRMKQEARAAARIKHPGVITIHDVLEQDGKPWIVMELIDGRSLAELVEQEGPLSPRDAADIGAKVLAALHRGHQAGVLHRDVKPANVLLERGTGRVVLTDFGIATYEGDSALTRTGDLVGSPDYLPPERVHGGRPGPESDLWGLGATIYAAVEGQSPFKRDTPITTLAAVVSEPLPEPRNAGALAPVLRALLAKEPSQRPPAEQAIRMLESVAAGHTMSVRGVVPPVVDVAERPWEQQTVTSGTPIPAVLRQPTGPIPLADRADGGSPTGHRVAPPPGGGSPTGPTEVRPHPAQPPGRRRFGLTVALAGLAAAVVAGGVAIAVMHYRTTGSTQASQHLPPASTAPTSSSSTGGQQSAAPVPTGYQVANDPAGFSFDVPADAGQPWTRYQRADGEVDYTPDADTATPLHLIRIGVTRGQSLSPFQHAQQMDQDHRQNGLPGYHLLAMNQATLNGAPAAYWRFTYTAAMPGTGADYKRYGVEELFKDTTTGTEYAIFVAMPYSDVTTADQVFQNVVNSFTVH